MKPDFSDRSNVDIVPKGLSREELRTYIFADFDTAEYNGTIDNPKLIKKLSDRYQLPLNSIRKYKQSWENETFKHQRDALRLKKEEMDIRRQMKEMELQGCPYCSRMSADHAAKEKDWSEMKLELKRKIENLEKDLKEANNEKHKLELAAMEARLRQPESSSPEFEKFKTLLYEKGFQSLTEPKSDTQYALDIVKEQLPVVLRESKEIIHELNTDNNPYPEEKEIRQKKVQKKKTNPQKVKPQRLAGDKLQTPPKKPVDSNRLNDLGKAFHKKFKDIPIDQVKIASDYIMQAYAAIGPERQAAYMRNMFRLLSRIRELGVYINRIEQEKPVPIINRPLSPEDAAEFIWKEQPKIGMELADKEYEFLLGMMYPFANHPIYRNDYDYLKRETSGKICERILNKLAELKRDS